MNKRVTLWRNDKIPYGTYYAYNNLQHIFTNAAISTNDHSPVTFYETNQPSFSYIIVGHTVRPSEKELKALLNHAIAGNHVFISAFDIGKNLLDSFKLKMSSGYLSYGDSMAVSVVDPSTSDSLRFVYPGVKFDNYFTQMDSSVTYVLGRNENGHPDFVKFSYQGGGTVLLHLAPAALTNFFLLHKQNKKYYDLVFSAIPDTVSEIRWDDYYRHHIDGNDTASTSAFSKLGTFLQNDVLRWAFWLALLLFAIIYLVESKRKQRIIPSFKKPDNTSLDFVKTIGRLYYQRKDNKNLARKMATHFLGHIRTRYNMQTSQLTDDFVERLSYKSGYPITLVKELIEEIKRIDDVYDVSDQEMLTFNDKMDKFINKA